MVLMDGKGGSWEEAMLEDVLGLRQELRAVVAKIPTDTQRKNAQALPLAERREIRAFVSERQDFVLKLLSAAEESTEKFREAALEAIVSFRQKETQFERSIDRFSRGSEVRMRVLRAVRPNGEKYATDIVQYLE